MLSAVAGAASMLGVVGVGMAAIDAVAGKEETLKRQLHAEVCARMDAYETERNAQTNRADCCLRFGRWLLVVGCLVELPLRWAYHSVVLGLFMMISATCWPLITCNPSSVGCIAQYWAFCLGQIAHHQVHVNLYLLAFNALAPALCGGVCDGTPWFFQRNLDLIRPTHPLLARSWGIVDGCGEGSWCCCCCNCLRVAEEYRAVLDPQQAAVRYFRSMFFFLSGGGAFHPALVCGRCCACCHHQAPLDRLANWAEERQRERWRNTEKFYQEHYQVGSYEDLEGQRVAALRAEEAQQRLVQQQVRNLQGGGGEAGTKPSVMMDVARAAVGMLLSTQQNNAMGNGQGGLSSEINNTVVAAMMQQLNPTAPPLDPEQGGEEEGSKEKEVGRGATKTTTAAGAGGGGRGRASSSSSSAAAGGGHTNSPQAPRQAIVGGLVSLAGSVMTIAVNAGQEALARRQTARPGAGGGGAVVAEAVPVMVVEEGGGGTIIPATVEHIGAPAGSNGKA